MIFFALIPALVQGAMTDVAYKMDDVICEIHIEAVMAKHGLPVSGPSYQVSAAADIPSDRIIRVSASADVVAGILKNEAPESVFQIGIAGKRQASSIDSMLSWITLSKDEIAGTVHAPFPVSELTDYVKSQSNLKELRLADVTSVKYAPRFFMGPDQEIHLALNILVGTADTGWKFQLIQNAPKVAGRTPMANGDLISEPDLLTHLKS